MRRMLLTAIVLWATGARAEEGANEGASGGAAPGPASGADNAHPDVDHPDVATGTDDAHPDVAAGTDDAHPDVDHPDVASGTDTHPDVDHPDVASGTDTYPDVDHPDVAAATTDDAPATDQPTAGRPVEKGTIGLGIVLGEPTGICGKLYLQDDQAIQVAAGAAFYGGGLQLHGDYVFHPWILQDRDSFVLPVYLGPGLRFIQYNEGAGDPAHYALGLRAVLGMLFDFKSVPLDVFVEVAGVLEYDFTDGAGVALNLGAGVRYYF